MNERHPFQALASSLESDIAKRQVAAALVKDGILNAADLGGDVATALADVAPSWFESERPWAAVEVAVIGIRRELDVLERRQRVCFALSVAFSLALVAAVVWVAYKASAKGYVELTNALAALAPTAGGGAMFSFYKHVSRQRNALRRDLMTLLRMVGQRRPGEPAAARRRAPLAAVFEP